MMQFHIPKLRIEDQEKLQDAGFNQTSTFNWQYQPKVNCCEVWNYALKPEEYKMTNDHKKILRKFHNYLNYGNIYGPDYQENLDPAFGGNNIQCPKSHRMKV